MIAGQEKPDLDSLAHFGVKGMRWGVRRAEKNTPNTSYTTAQRSRDEQLYGKAGVQRINRRMNSGKSRKDALRSEGRRSTAITLGQIGIGVAITGAKLYEKQVNAQLNKTLNDAQGKAYQVRNETVTRIKNRAETNRGRAAFSSMMGLPQTESRSTVRSPKRGVYTVTTMR